jgi:MYXO-CTERM domain-containing protein
MESQPAKSVKLALRLVRSYDAQVSLWREKNMQRTLWIAIVTLGLLSTPVMAETALPYPDAEVTDGPDGGSAEGTVELASPPVKDPQDPDTAPLNYDGSGADDGGCQMAQKSPSALWWMLLPGLLFLLRRRENAQRPQLLISKSSM